MLFSQFTCETDPAKVAPLRLYPSWNLNADTLSPEPKGLLTHSPTRSRHKECIHHTWGIWLTLSCKNAENSGAKQVMDRLHLALQVIVF